MEGITQEIPSDVMKMFFARVDSKTFARCRTLSKYWCNALKDPFSISMHLSITYGNTILLHLRHPLLDFLLGTISLYDITLKKETIVAPPAPWRGFYLIGSVEGYILAKGSWSSRGNTPPNLDSVISIPVHIKDSIFCINHQGLGNRKTIFGLSLRTLIWSECVIPKELNNVFNSRLIAQKERLVYLSMDPNRPGSEANLTDLTICDGQIVRWGPTTHLRTHNFYYTPNIMINDDMIGIDRETMINPSTGNDQNRITRISFTKIDTPSGGEYRTGSISRNSIIRVVDSFIFQHRIDDTIGFI
ncbi:hypothetical protein PIB30_019146 [Stylosanthes scabra]|uniref:F-box domain-containing protein n=1 Tax=Stylosanthes scabra TaxID=79078 RepID=A0ABU6X9S9_9FABA|nr:hypothetical protein [Stylosanthes scabra]